MLSDQHRRENEDVQMSDWTSFGRIDEDGTVYVKTGDGERVVGSWQAGTPEEGLAHFARRYADLAFAADETNPNAHAALAQIGQAHGTWSEVAEHYAVVRTRRRLTDDEVKLAIESLPEAFRIAVLLADVEGFSYKEIAEITDVPIGTVMSRIHRGRKALQKALLDYAVARGLVGSADSGH